MPEEDLKFHMTVAPVQLTNGREINIGADLGAFSLYQVLLQDKSPLINNEFLSYRDKIIFNVTTSFRNRIGSGASGKRKTLGFILPPKHVGVFNENVATYINDVVKYGNVEERYNKDLLVDAEISEYILNLDGKKPMHLQLLESYARKKVPSPLVASLETDHRIVGMVLDSLVQDMNVRNIENTIPSEYFTSYSDIKSIFNPRPITRNKVFWNSLLKSFPSIHPAFNDLSDASGVSDYAVLMATVMDQENLKPSNLSDNSLVKLVKCYNTLSGARILEDPKLYNSMKAQFVLSYTIRTILLEMERNLLIKIQ